jgi:hypothetical protein
MPQLPDPLEILREAESMRSFIVDLTLRICRERTVNYSLEDFPGGGPDGMKSPGEEGKVVAILQRELEAHSITGESAGPSGQGAARLPQADGAASYRCRAQRGAFGMEVCAV